MNGARLRQRVVARSRSSLRELLAPERPQDGGTAWRGPEVPYARPPTPPSYLDGREAEMIYWRSCESSAFRAAALFLCPFSPPRHVARQRDLLPCESSARPPPPRRANRAFCGRPPRADPTKCEVSPHCSRNAPAALVLAPVYRFAGMAGWGENAGLSRHEVEDQCDDSQHACATEHSLP